MSAAKTARWLDLVAFLMDRTEAVTRETIFERIPGYRKDWQPDNTRAGETLRRKFERDKDELREWGIDIESVELHWAAYDEPRTGYRLNPRSTYLPYLAIAGDRTDTPLRPYRRLRELRLTERDIGILDRATQRLAQREESPLKRAALSLRRKIEFDLPLSVSAVERVLANPLTSESERSLETLQDAVAERIRVTCVYYAIGTNEEHERVIEPYGLFFTWGKWYVVARAPDRNDLRVFRVDRMRNVKRVKGKAASFAPPESFDIQPYLNRAPWELSNQQGERVVVRFDFPESRRVLARGLGEPVEAMLEDGGSRIAFHVADRGPLLRWLLTFRGAARVESPDDIRTALDDLRTSVARLYEDSA